MLVRKCDVCGHIIGDEVAYNLEVSRLAAPIAGGSRYLTRERTMEICHACKEAAFSALNERMTKCVLMGKEEEEEEQ